MPSPFSPFFLMSFKVFSVCTTSCPQAAATSPPFSVRMFVEPIIFVNISLSMYVFVFGRFKVHFDKRVVVWNQIDRNVLAFKECAQFMVIGMESLNPFSMTYSIITFLPVFPRFSTAAISRTAAPAALVRTSRNF